MKEIIITSSVLILAVIALRFLFRSKVSRRLIYCAWLLVALRLLVPVQFGSLNFSILTQAEPVTEVITDIVQKPVAGPSREEVYNDTLRDYISQERPVFVPEVQEQVDAEVQQSNRSPQEVYNELLESSKPENILLPEVQEEIQTVVSETVKPTLGQIATVVWVIGMVAMAGWFVGVNLSFRRKLRESTPLELSECKTPVKVSAELASPCLFGLLRPTVYLIPCCVDDEKKRNHVLTHELTHLRSGDHIWAWVRCICLCIYWFNPLVWVAASLSRRDCELACDEAALKTLGESERLAYGKTLVDMVSFLPAPGQLLETATAMHETKKQLKERVKCIAKKPKVFLTAAIALLLVLTLVTGCAFSGAFSSSPGDDPQTTSPSTTITPPTSTTVENPTALDELKRLAAEADEMMKEGGIYSFPFPWFWEGAVDPTKANSYMDREGDTLIINTDMSKVDFERVGYELFYRDIRYDLFLGLLSREYGDCITEGDCDHKPEYSHVPAYYVFFCLTYKEEGFSTIKECWDAVRKGEHTLRSEAYLITYGYYRPDIKDYHETDLNATLRDAIFPPVGDPPADLVPLSFPVRDTMRRLATKATKMMEDKNGVTVSDDAYRFYSHQLDEYVTWQNGVIHVDTNVDPENQKGVYKNLHFLLFCSLVLEEYRDCVAEYTGVEGYLLLYPGYKEDGFATIEDCLAAWEKGEFEITGEAYSICYYIRGIYPHPYNDPYGYDIAQFVLRGIETDEDNNTDPTEPTTPPTQPPEEQELAYFNALFANDDPEKHNRYWYATGHTYTNPLELKLMALFDGGFADEPKVTDAERKELSELVPAPEALQIEDIKRLPTLKMEEELQEVFGISLRDLVLGGGFEGLYFLDSTDCFYLISGGMTSLPAHSPMRTVVHNDNGTVTLTYDLPGGSGAITLRPNGDGWRVVSNIQDMPYG